MNRADSHQPQAEAEIASHRAALAEALAETRRRAAIGYIGRQAIAAVAPSTAPVWPAAARRIADHPVGFALTLAGLAYLAMGPEPAPPDEQWRRLKGVARKFGASVSARVRAAGTGLEEAARPVSGVVGDVAADIADGMRATLGTAAGAGRSAASAAASAAPPATGTASETARMASEVGAAARREAAFHARKASAALSDHIGYVAAAAFVAGVAGGLASRRGQGSGAGSGAGSG
ncbi:MAG: hypothetical protein ACOY4T_15015 [Pseudomonadota bacterium]